MFDVFSDPEVCLYVVGHQTSMLSLNPKPSGSTPNPKRLDPRPVNLSKLLILNPKVRNPQPQT